MQKGILKLKVLSTTNFPLSNSSCYKLKVGGMESTHSTSFAMMYGNGASCLGFLLYKKQISGYGKLSGASAGGGTL